MAKNKNTIKFNNSKVADVVSRWGDRMPIMACEECGELTVSISKMTRATTVYELSEATQNLIKEMADVEISMAALRQIYGIPVGAVNEAINRKLNMKK